MDLGHAVNSAADWISSAPLVRTVVNNPVFTAMLIVALAAIIIMGLYHYQIKRAGLKQGLRALLYVFLAVLAVVFVHHYAVMRLARATAAQTGIREVFAGIEQSRAGISPGAIPVTPMGFEETPAAVRGGAPRALASAPAGASAEAHASAPAPAGRPDNVMVGRFEIKDVVVPSVGASPRPPRAA